ncbi:MAG TPA: toll/interleukin-1 receptor domain-containing protein [Thermoanaerobaculia bacterium]|nr:toll/interleukin-1 receptor domain-containing protein [Thermoanaerobaculia bacterium]
MPRVFISYSGRDARWVNELTDLLRVAFRLAAVDFFAFRVSGAEIPPGNFIAEAVREAISSAEVFIVVLSRTSVRSPYVLSEVGARWGTGKPILPVLTRGTTAEALPSPLAEMKALICSISDLHELIRIVGNQLDEEPQPAASYQAHLERLVKTKYQLILSLLVATSVLLTLFFAVVLNPPRNSPKKRPEPLPPIESTAPAPVLRVIRIGGADAQKKDLEVPPAGPVEGTLEGLSTKKYSVIALVTSGKYELSEGRIDVSPGKWTLPALSFRMPGSLGETLADVAITTVPVGPSQRITVKVPAPKLTIESICGMPPEKARWSRGHPFEARGTASGILARERVWISIHEVGERGEQKDRCFYVQPSDGSWKLSEPWNDLKPRGEHSIHVGLTGNPHADHVCPQDQREFREFHLQKEGKEASR